MSEFEQYISPFSWRYASQAMRQIWSETYKRQLWRRIWLELAEVQAEYGLVKADQLEDLRAHVGDVDVKRALEIEADIHHDLMAELMVYAEQSPVGGGSLHLGATSMDIEDNAEAIRIRAALDLILSGLKHLLGALADQILSSADTEIIAFTHLQPAEPSTLGYRLAQYGQDLLMDLEWLDRLRGEVRGKGFKGAVGTGASFGALLGDEHIAGFEARVMARLALPYFPVTTQTYPRKQEYVLTSALASLGGSLYKFAFDLRILQSPLVGEIREPFGRDQVGSSAMPFKRNPIQAEKIDSLARALAQMPRLAWDNAAHSLLERTLDDSANRRSLLPEAFLISDELLAVATRILLGLQIDHTALTRNLKIFGPFAAQERLLMALVREGANRQVMHEVLRTHALKAWEAIQRGDLNPLVDSLCQEQKILAFLPEGEVRTLLATGKHVGNAPQRARELAFRIKAML